MSSDPIFEPLHFRNLTVKNRLFRSSLSGRFDHYDGTGTDVRINWDVKFAKNGVGTVISSNSPVDPRGLIIPGYASIDRDDRTPFWRELGRRVHEHDCAYIVQIAHSGRQRDMGGIEYPMGISSTDKPEPIHGLECERMTVAQIEDVVQKFADAARRAREAGLDGVEIHGCNGYLITQFLSSAINDRDDDYGGSLENRARFPLEIVRAIRDEVGDDYHLQFKISAVEDHDAVIPWLGEGNTLEESIQVCKWLEEAGVDGFHISSGSSFPHPRTPPGTMSLPDIVSTYDTVISSGKHTFRNYLAFRTFPFNRAFKWRWEQASKNKVEGINLDDARAVKKAVSVPVIVTGGFQTASVIRNAIANGWVDGVSMARTLMANPDLPLMFQQGLDRAPRPCTYCNKCLVNFIEHPVGCYEESRYDSREEMIAEIFSVFHLGDAVSTSPAAPEA